MIIVMIHQVLILIMNQFIHLMVTFVMIIVIHTLQVIVVEMDTVKAVVEQEVATNTVIIAEKAIIVHQIIVTNVRLLQIAPVTMIVVAHGNTAQVQLVQPILICVQYIV